MDTKSHRRYKDEDCPKLKEPMKIQCGQEKRRERRKLEQKRYLKR
ncbi:MAG: hypothetical protein AABY15_06965 [Nanoarchaeota archaeon]